MGCAACARDDGANAATLRGFGVSKHIIGHAVRRDNFGFKRHAELFEYVCRVFHNRPVGVTAHEDADDGGCVVHVFPLFNR